MSVYNGFFSLTEALFLKSYKFKIMDMINQGVVTAVAALIIYILTKYIENSIFKPITRLKELRAKTASYLYLYAQFYSSPKNNFQIEIDEERAYGKTRILISEISAMHLTLKENWILKLTHKKWIKRLNEVVPEMTGFINSNDGLHSEKQKQKIKNILKI